MYGEQQPTDRSVASGYRRGTTFGIYNLAKAGLRGELGHWDQGGEGPRGSKCCCGLVTDLHYSLRVLLLPPVHWC